MIPKLIYFVQFQYAFERFESVPGLYPVMPDGAMYMMVGLDRKAFPEFANCLKIVEGMVREQSVFCLPGKCFGINDFFRVVLTGKQSYRFIKLF